MRIDPGPAETPAETDQIMTGMTTLTCPAGVIANGQLFRCERELGHDKMHYSTAAGASLWWWGADETAEIEA